MTSGAPPSLNPHQIEQIVRDRLAGLQYKTIARRVGCTWHQAHHYWRISTAYKPQFNRAASAKRREAGKVPARQEKRRIDIAQQQTIAASKALHQEISLAVGEASQARPFKPGPLEWGL